MSDLHIPRASCATPPPPDGWRLPWPVKEPPHPGMAVVTPAERRDLHATARMLEEVGHPGVVSKSHFWKFWR